MNTFCIGMMHAKAIRNADDAVLLMWGIGT